MKKKMFAIFRRLVLDFWIMKLLKGIESISGGLIICHFIKYSERFRSFEILQGFHTATKPETLYKFPKKSFFLAWSVHMAKYKAWMTEIDGNKHISEINIPGTHNSAAVGHAFPITLFGCQDRSIKKQLNSGIRLFDIRIKVKKTSNHGFSFVTCHGDILSGAELNEYGPLESIFQDFYEYLASTPGETIIVLLKIDDWGTLSTWSSKRLALDALVDLLKIFDCKALTNNERLQDMRGSIFLLNRITNNITYIGLGAPIGESPTDGWEDDVSKIQTFPSNGIINYTFIVQDNYHPQSRDMKLNLIKTAISNKKTNEILLNFANAMRRRRAGLVKDRYINVAIQPWLKTLKTASQNVIGWMLFDFPFDHGNIVNTIILSNFP